MTATAITHTTPITWTDVKLDIVSHYILMREYVKWMPNGTALHTWYVYIVSPDRRTILGSFQNAGAAFRFARQESKLYDLPLLQGA